MNNQIVGNRADGDRLLREPKEVLPTAFGFSAVEAEGKFIQIVVKVLVTDGALMGLHEPAFEQRENAVDAGQAVRKPLSLLLLMTVTSCTYPRALTPL